MNAPLPAELADFIDAKVSKGEFGSSSEVVHAALRLMERIERENGEKIEDLRRAYREGLDSGDAGDIDFAALKAEGRAKLAALKA